MIPWIIIFSIFFFALWTRIYYIPNVWVKKSKREELRQNCNLVICFSIFIIIMYYKTGAGELLWNIF